MAVSLPYAHDVSLTFYRGLGRVVFTFAVLLSFLWMTTPKYKCVNRIHATVVRSNLRDLQMAQDEFHAAHGRYAKRIEQLDPQRFRLYPNVTIRIALADADGWQASGTHRDKPGLSCSVGNGVDFPPCFQERTSAERNVLRPGLGSSTIEMWLIWLSVLRRQRRAAIATAWREPGPAA